MIFEERTSLVDNEGEEFSEYEDHVSVDSDSDSELEEEDEIDHQPAMKKIHLQSGPNPGKTFFPIIS